MGKLVKSNTKAKAIALLATGETQQGVANEIGVSQSSISNLAKKHHEEIKELALSLISESISLVKANHINTLKLARQILTAKDSKQMQDMLCKLAMLDIDAKDILQLSDKKEERALKIMGIAPAHVPSTVVNMLFTSEPSITPEEHSQFREYMKWKMDKDVQEIEEAEKKDKKEEQ